jgi:serine/threonine-protein kinase ATR
MISKARELVPFRLTHNMVDAFGIAGYEGCFRKACEITLRVLRDHKESLMDILQTFVHDPVDEWKVTVDDRKFS